MLISKITAIEKIVSIHGRLVDVVVKNKSIIRKYGQRAIIEAAIMDAQQDKCNCNNVTM